LRTIPTKNHLPLQKLANAAQGAEEVNVLEDVNANAIPDAEMLPIWALSESPPIPLRGDRITALATEATPLAKIEAMALVEAEVTALVEAEATNTTLASQPRSLKA